MNKSVIVIDTPETCSECRLFETERYHGCRIGSREHWEEKPKWCPLKPFLFGEELRKFRNTIKDKNTLIGFNMAVEICNKYLGENNESNISD